MSTEHRPRLLSLTYGAARFDVQLSYRDGDRLTIHVHPDQRVTVTAPAEQPWERIRARLKVRAAWIAKQTRYFERFRPPPAPRRYVSGETLLYLGRQYRLRVRKADKPQVRLVGQFLRVDLPNPSANVTKLYVQRWDRARAHEALQHRLGKCMVVTSSLGLQPPELRLRRMKTRWGSCTTAGVVVLHPDLVMVPGQCIDYVIVHELCHRKVLRHDSRFFRLLTRYLPDWKSRKSRLDSFVIGES